MAEFLNSLNYSISGFFYVQTGGFESGPACTANGFLGQMTAQAIDFTMLAIVITALLTIIQRYRPENISSNKKWMICASTWIMPISTSVAAIGMHVISPVSGNWCWISATSPELQYALAHGWRLAIIFTIVLMYCYMCWLLYKRFRSRAHDGDDSSLQDSSFGSLSSGVTPTDVIEVKPVIVRTERCESPGSWLPIQSPVDNEKSPAIFPRRQIGHINSLHNLGAPSRTQAFRQEVKSLDHKDWLCEILNISRCCNPVSRTPEDGQTGRTSFDSGPNLPVQLPEVHQVPAADSKAFGDIFALRPDTWHSGPHVNPTTTGPRYHNQCPKVTKTVQISVDEVQRSRSMTVKTGPNYHSQCPKVTKSVQISVDEAGKPSETISIGPRYHNQCPKVTRTIDISTDKVEKLSIAHIEDSGPRYHNQCPKVTRTVGVSIDRVATPPATHVRDPLPSTIQGAGPRYHQQCPKVQRSFSVVTDQKYEKAEAEPGPRYHNQCPKVTRSVNVSTSSKPGPNYHSECPLVKRSVSVSVDQAISVDTNTNAGPRYHNQCPKVTRSFKLSTTGPDGGPLPQVATTKPLPPPPVLLPHECKTETTVITSPMAPPPSPTPGLPPPPWSPATASPSSRIQFKRPAFLSRSTWSDSSRSTQMHHPITPWGDPHNAPLTSRLLSATEDFLRRCLSFVAGLRDWYTYEDSEIDINATSTREIRRALFLNAYPLAYILLWLPGIVDRFMQADGVQPINSRAMAALQSCTQLIPLANALTFGVGLYLRWKGGRGGSSSRLTGQGISWRRRRTAC